MLYFINLLAEGLITNINIDDVKMIGGSSSGGGVEATPATIVEVQNQTAPTTENKKYITLYNIAEWLKSKNSFTFTSSSKTDVSGRLRWDGSKLGLTDSSFIERFLAFDDNGVNVPQIQISSASLNTTIRDSNGLSQHGKNVQVLNTGNATVSVVSGSEANFLAVYVKIGTGTLTFTAGSGVTLVQANGTNVISENTQCKLERVGSTNTFILHA